MDLNIQRLQRLIDTLEYNRGIKFKKRFNMSSWIGIAPIGDGVGGRQVRETIEALSTQILGTDEITLPLKTGSDPVAGCDCDSCAKGINVDTYRCNASACIAGFAALTDPDKALWIDQGEPCTMGPEYKLTGVRAFAHWLGVDQITAENITMPNSVWWLGFKPDDLDHAIGILRALASGGSAAVAKYVDRKRRGA